MGDSDGNVLRTEIHSTCLEPPCIRLEWSWERCPNGPWGNPKVCHGLGEFLHLASALLSIDVHAFFFLLLIVDAVNFLVQAYTVALRFADSSSNLSASTAERDCLTARVQELEKELEKTQSELKKVRTELATSSRRKLKAVAKAKELKDQVASLKSEL